jgi:hypothetical protein
VCGECKCLIKSRKHRCANPTKAFSVFGRFAREHLDTGFNREGFGRALAGLWQENSGTECPRTEKALAGLWQENSGTECPRTEKALAGLWQENSGTECPRTEKALAGLW